MPFPWEAPEAPAAALRMARSLRRPPASPLDEILAPPPAPEFTMPAAPPPDEPGMLEDLGDFLDRFTGDNLLRSIAAGEPGRGLRSIVPFGESLGIYDPHRDHVSGQEVNQKIFGIQPEGDLFSGAGAAGLGTEMALSLSNFLPGFMGVKSLTKAGRATKLVGGHLDEAGRAAAAAERAAKNALARAAAEKAAGGAEELLTRAPKAAYAHPIMGELFNEGARVSERELVERLAKTEGPAGEAARELLASAGGNDAALRLLPEAGDRVRAGQEALLSVGGEYNPFGLLGLGGKYNPLNATPLTKPWFELPTKTIVEGADAAQGLQNIGRKIGEFAAPVTDPIANLFRKIPGVKGEAAAELERSLQESLNERGAGHAEALDRAALLDEEIKTLQTGAKPPRDYTDLVNAAEREDPELLGRIDPHTGEISEAEQAFEELKQSPPLSEVPPLDKAPAPVDIPEGAEMPAPLGNPLDSFIPDVPAAAPAAAVVDLTPRPGGAVTFSLPDLRIKKGTKGVFVGVHPEAADVGRVKVGNDVLNVPMKRIQVDTRTAGARQYQADLQAIPEDARKSVKARAADTARAIDALRIEDLDRLQAENSGFSIGAGERARSVAKGQLVKDEVAGLGFDASPVGKADALPQILEQLLPKVEEGTHPLPQLKAVDLVGDVAPGDKFKLAGREWTAKELTQDGKIHLQDHDLPDINVPEGMVPKDKGAEIHRAPLNPIEDLVPAPKYGKLNKAADVLAQTELKLGVKPADLPFESGRIPEPTPEIGPLGSEVPRPIGSTPAGFIPDVPAPKDVKQLEGIGAAANTSLGQTDITPIPSANAKSIEKLEERIAWLNKKLQTGGQYKGRGGDLDLVRQLEGLRGSRVSQAQVTGYLVDAGESIDAAAKRTAKILPEDLAAEVKTRVSNLLEHSGAETPEIVSMAEKIRDRYETMFAAEKAAGLDVAELKSSRLSYTTHVSTDAGHGFFKSLGKNEKQQAALFKQLEEARLGRGVEGNPDALLTKKQLTQKRISETLSSPAPADLSKTKFKGVPQSQQTFARDRLMRLDAETREFIVDNELVREYMAFSKDIANTHPSMIPRMPAFRDLGVSELNEAFKKFGAKGPVFNENPAAQLFAREARHAKAMAGATFFDKAAELGHELPNRVGKEVPGKGVEDFSDGSVGVSELNRQRARQGLHPIGFEPDTAAAIAEVYNKLANPEEVGPLLGWYDKITHLMKGAVTRFFPAHHVQNHIGNRIQSYIGGVPLSGDHYELANKVIAGKDVSINVAGKIYDREALLKMIRKEGVSRGGWYENLVKESLDMGGSQGSWNPLKPLAFIEKLSDNAVMNFGEHIGAGLAGGPGQLAAGAGVGKLGEMSGKIVEDVDRVGHFLYKWQREGLAPAEAAASVNKYLFDYGKESMSPFEAKFASRAVFFYGYTRNVIPMMLDAMLHNTTKVKQISQLGLQPGGPEHKPSFAREGLPIPLGKDADGNSMMSYRLGTPLEAALEPFSGFAGGFGRGIAKGLSQLNPIVKAPLELGSGQDLFLGKPIEEARKAPHWVEDLPDPMQEMLGVAKIPKKDGTFKYEMDPEILWLLRNSPLSRLSNTAGRVTDDKKGALENLLNLVTGTRIISVDDEEEVQRALKDAARKRLRELEREGKVKSPEIFAADVAGKGDPEVKALLDQLSGKKPAAR